MKFETLLKKAVVCYGEDGIELTTQEIIASENNTLHLLSCMATDEELVGVEICSKDYGIAIPSQGVIKKVSTDKNGTTAIMVLVPSKVDDSADIVRILKNAATVTIEIDAVQGKLFNENE